MKYPFEADYQEILANPDSFVTAVFSSLESEFLLLPRGQGFIEYPAFEAAYEALKKVTADFSQLPRDQIIDLASSTPLCLIVIREALRVYELVEQEDYDPQLEAALRHTLRSPLRKYKPGHFAAVAA